MLTGTPEADPFRDLRLYLPPNTDLDVADVLNSLYRSHCTSLVENLRHIKLRSFWNVFSSFNGTMTVPVQKLFSDPMISPWIESCDQVMYREMARMLSKLTNLAVPPLVLQSLTQISQELCNHIRNTFGSYPLPLVSARTRPAATFQAFVRRLVKVNEATHAVGKLISNLAERRLMHSDWTTQVDIPAIIQGELPGCAPQQVYNLLSMTVPNLLHPLLPDADHEQICDPPLDRWIALIDSIPSQFGHVDAWVLISIVGRVTSAALRDITSRGGNSFNAWWVVKMWIDEKLRFMAEEGGLLDLSGYLTTSSVDSSLLSGDDADVSGLPASQVRFNPTVRSGLVGTQKKVSHDIFNSHTGHQTSSAGFDDSGIGMQSSEEEPDRSDDSVRAKHGFTSESERISTLG